MAPKKTKKAKERAISIKWKVQKSNTKTSSSTDENSSILTNLKGSAYSAYQTYFAKEEAEKSSLVKEFVQIINYWCISRERDRKLVNFQSESLANLVQFLKTDTFYQEFKIDIKDFTLNLLATKDLATKNHRLEVDSVQEPKLNDFVNILEMDDTDVNYYIIPAIGKVVNEDPFQVSIEHHNHIHYEKKYSKKTPISVSKDMTSVIEAYEETEPNFSTMLPSNRISVNITPSKRKSKAKKPSCNEISDNNSEPTNKMSTRKNKSKTAAPKRKNQSDEDESSTDTDNDSEPSKKKQFKPSSSKQLVKTVKKTMSVHDSDSDESTTEDSENGTSDSTESVYFQVRHVNGKREYVIVPEHVDYIFDLIDKDKAFPEFINAIIQCEKVLTDLTKRFAHLFSGLAFNTTVNGITYSIPPDIIKMLIGNVTQKQCLELLAHHHFKKPIGELTTDQRTVCRKFFEARGWDKESVRKAINSLIKE